MPTRKTTSKNVQQEIQESAHKIWLAGLGALSAAGEGSTRLFQQFVEKGEGVEKEGRKRVETSVDDARARIDSRVRSAKGQVESTVDEVLSKVDERLTEALHRFGVPTRGEIQNLTRRVEELNKKVDQLRTKPAAGAAPAATAAPRKIYHVGAHDEGWKVEAEGATRATSVHPTKEEAVNAARELAQNQRPSQVIIHKKDGAFQTEYTYDAEVTN